MLRVAKLSSWNQQKPEPLIGSNEVGEYQLRGTWIQFRCPFYVETDHVLRNNSA